MKLNENDLVTVYWTNAGSNWSGHAIIKTVNRKSYVITLTEPIYTPPNSYRPNELAYPIGQSFPMPSEDKWTPNNRIELGLLPLSHNINRTLQPTFKKIPKQKIHNSLFNKESITPFRALLESNLNFPFVNTSLSSLGGQDNLTLFVAISKDDPSTWSNHIFENSRSAKISIQNNGEVEQISGWKLNLRKFTSTDIATIINKINSIKTKQQ